MVFFSGDWLRLKVETILNEIGLFFHLEGN